MQQSGISTLIVRLILLGNKVGKRVVLFSLSKSPWLRKANNRTGNNIHASVVIRTVRESLPYFALGVENGSTVDVLEMEYPRN